MQLKSIQISGFKSFADKTVINMPDGITAIVGPNGSGKSNIAEAVRWVLGEQSAKTLRGQKMTDVIFSGAENRKAMNLAKVTIILDNSDQYLKTPYKEIAVTRKLFRNGDSWYGINNQECRLKDITELFMDSGLGADAYSIISQGNVEGVLSSTAEQRRYIIENLAGIYQYKQQKKTTQSNIESTNDNLTRLNDIIFELEQRLPKLKDESDIAADYLTQKQQLDTLKEQQIGSQYASLLSQLELKSNNLENLTETKNQAQQQIKTAQGHITALKQKIVMIEQDNDTQRDRHNKEMVKKEQLEGQLKLIKQQQQYQRQAVNNLANQIQQANESLSKQEDELAQWQQQKRELDQQITQKNGLLDQYQRQIIELNIKPLQSDLAKIQDQRLKLLEQQTVGVTRVEELQKQQSQQEQETANFIRRKQEQQKQIAIQEKQINTLKQDIETLELNLDQQKQQLNKLQQQRQEQQKQLELTTQKWQQLINQKEQLKSQLTYEDRSVQEHHSYHQGVQSLLKQRNDFNGLWGTVADFIDTSNRYTLAIETALGGRLQNVIVDNDGVAKEAISYLTKNKLGRVTFLPIQSLKEHKIEAHLLNQIKQLPGYIGVAADLVSINEKLTKIQWFLLGNTVVADNLTNALTINQTAHQRIKVVTLDGQVVNPGGTLTGGAQRHGTGHFLADKQQVKATKQKYQDVLLLGQQQEVNLTANQANKRKLEQEIDNQKQQISDRLELLNQKKREKENVIASRHTLINQATISKNQIQQRQNSLQDIKRLKLTNQQLTVDLERVNRKITQINQTINEKTTIQLNLRAKQATETESLSKLNQQQSYISINIEQISKLLNSTKQQLQNFKDNQKQQNMVTDAEIKEVEQQIVDCKERLSKQATSDNNLKQQQITLSDELTNWQDTLNQAEVQVATIIQQVATQRQNTSTLKQRLEELIIKLKQEYHYTDNQLIQLKGAQLTSSKVATKIALLEKGLNEIGAVNVGAIDEYNSVNKRYHFLIKQRQDVQDSLKNLQNTIHKIDRLSAQQFEESFKKLALAFNTVFKEMFGGGKAQLIMTDPDRPLTSGIDIMAMPPGKKNRPLSLLSGGEKALTAISLLFAILKIQPVPFCILDEVEAALDPANVERFAKYLKFFTNETQFIVITHRKETMVFVDQMYGVTMQNYGVSNLVSVVMTD